MAFFFMAVLTDRAVKIGWDGSKVPLELLFTQPSINWTWDPLDIAQIDGTGGTIQLNYIVNATAKHEVRTLFAKEDLNSYYPNARTLSVNNNQGQLDMLFKNPHHMHRLASWGLRPETAFGCAFHYLFEPTAATILPVYRPYHVLATQSYGAGSPSKRNISIGIHIRLGDEFINAGSACDAGPCLPETAMYFSCAQQLEDDLNSGQEAFNVVWYLVTDCAGLRAKAKSLFGDKLLTSVDVPITHTIDPTGHNSSLRVVQSGLYVAYGENLVLSMTDYQVLTPVSAFGIVASLRSLRYRNVFAIHKGEGSGDPDPRRGARMARDCRAEDFDEYTDLAGWWINVRR